MKLTDLYEYELNKIQQSWYVDMKATIVVSMPPELFLRLTTATKTMEPIKSKTQSKEFYQDLMNQEKIHVPPFLSLERSGQVVGHEGRSRALAAMNAGDKEFQVGILLYPSTRNASLKDIPAVWIGQFNKSVKFGFGEGNVNSIYGPVKVLNPNVQQQYQKESVNEYGVGRIVPGVNTTVDVKPDHIKTQAAKWGFDVDIDGRPPLLTDQKTLLQKLFDIQTVNEKRIPKTHIPLSRGAQNEYVFAVTINNLVDSSEHPINVVITDGKSKINIPKVTHVNFVGRNINKGDKADVVLIGSKLVPISIKQDNADYWGKTERLFGIEGTKVIQDLVKKKKVGLEKIEDYYKLSSEIVYKVPDAVKQKIVFGDDNAVVIKRTFSEDDFSFDGQTLTIRVSEILKSVADLKGANDVYFLIRNDRSRRSKQMLPGITMSAVTPSRALSPQSKANRVIIS